MVLFENCRLPWQDPYIQVKVTVVCTTMAMFTSK